MATEATAKSTKATPKPLVQAPGERLLQQGQTGKQAQVFGSPPLKEGERLTLPFTLPRGPSPVVPDEERPTHVLKHPPKSHNEWVRGLHLTPLAQEGWRRGYSPEEIVAGKHYSRFALPPAGGPNYQVGDIAGIPFRQGNQTEGNVEYAPSEKLTWARIPYSNLDPRREVHGSEQGTSGTAHQFGITAGGIPALGGDFDPTLNTFAETRKDIDSPMARFGAAKIMAGNTSARGGRTLPVALRDARKRSYLRARMARAMGGMVPFWYGGRIRGW